MRPTCSGSSGRSRTRRQRPGASTRTGWRSCAPIGARSASARPAPTARPPSRTPAGCATPSASPCPWASRTRTSPSWPIRSATSWAATPARTDRSPPSRRPPPSASHRASPATCWRASPLRAAWSAASSARSPAAPASRARRTPSTATSRCSGASDAAASPGCVTRSSRCRRRGTPPSCRGGSGSPPSGARSELRGVDGCYDVIEQLAGTALPASTWLRSVLPARVDDVHDGMLDELIGSGDVVWWGVSALAGGDGIVCLAPTDRAPLLRRAADGRRRRPGRGRGPGRPRGRRCAVLPRPRRPGRRGPVRRADHLRRRPRRDPVATGVVRRRHQRRVERAARPHRRCPAPARHPSRAARACPSAPARPPAPDGGRCSRPSWPTRRRRPRPWARPCSTGTAS